MDKTKYILRIALAVTLIAVAYAAVIYVGAYSDSIQQTASGNFSVSAEGKVIAIPDVAEFTFTVITPGGKNLKTIQTENTKKMSNAISFVESEGVDKKDIKTQNYSVIPRYQSYSCPKNGGSCPPPDIVGYTITQTVAVKVRDFSKIGDILSNIISKGVNSISQLKFIIDNPSNVQAEARADAIKKAKEKAEAIAKDAGFNIGRLLSISESSNRPHPIYRLSSTMVPAPETAVSSSASPKIEAGSQEVKIDITLKYEIKR